MHLGSFKIAASIRHLLKLVSILIRLLMKVKYQLRARNRMYHRQRIASSQNKEMTRIKQFRRVVQLAL